MEKFFSSQQDDEEVIMIIRRHWFEVIGPYILGGFIYLFGLFALFALPVMAPIVQTGPGYDIWAILVSLMFLFNTSFIFSIWLIHYLNVGVITTEHVVDINQESLFSRQISELGLDKIQDVCANQKGMSETMFNFGTVTVETAGEAPNFVFDHVPNPNETSQKIMELEEEYAKRHGLRAPNEASEYLQNGQPNQENTESQTPNIEYPQG